MFNGKDLTGWRAVYRDGPGPVDSARVGIMRPDRENVSGVGNGSPEMIVDRGVWSGHLVEIGDGTVLLDLVEIGGPGIGKSARIGTTRSDREKVSRLGNGNPERVAGRPVGSGDLVKIGRNGGEYGLILWMHPTKGLMRVYWPDSNEIGYEKCIRVVVVSRI